MAKRLLVEADRKEDDPQIKKIIGKRIKDLDNKIECVGSQGL